MANEKLDTKSRRRGLGRGLDALFEDDEGDLSALAESIPEAVANDSSSRRTLGIEQLAPNPEQPRYVFDDAALEDLCESIREHGILQPILVRPHKTKDGEYEIIAGERRWRAAQMAQLHEVPVIIKELDDSAALQIALIENLQRQDLNAIEEAKGYQRLMEEFEHTQESVSEVLGKSRSHVANMIRLLNLPSSVQTMVSQGELSAGHARALIKAENPTLLAQEIIGKGMSVRQAERMVANLAGRENSSSSGTGKSGSGGAQKKDADTLALENELSNALGMHVRINMKGEHAGEVSVQFKNLDQLDLILQKLSHRQ